MHRKTNKFHVLHMPPYYQYYYKRQRALAVRTSSKAARPALPFQHIFVDALDVRAPRLRFFHRCRPADPLIASEWREVVPYSKYRRRRYQSFPQICRYGVHYSCRYPFIHRMFLTVSRPTLHAAPSTAESTVRYTLRIVVDLVQ